jgi:cytochrome c oxidase subunit 3
LSQAHYVVEGANLVRNEYGSKLFADFFSLSLVSRIPRFSGVIINIIIFFNVLVGTYEKEKVMKW